MVKWDILPKTHFYCYFYLDQKQFSVIMITYRIYSTWTVVILRTKKLSFWGSIL